jgi:hypothetical protein
VASSEHSRCCFSSDPTAPVSISTLSSRVPISKVTKRSFPRASRVDERRKTKPNKANAVKSKFFFNLSDNPKKQSHCVFPGCFQWLSAKKGPFFEKNEWIGDRSINWAPPGKTKPNKANVVKSKPFFNLSHNRKKQSHCVFPACFQWLSAKKRPFFAKNEWIDGPHQQIGAGNCRSVPRGHQPGRRSSFIDGTRSLGASLDRREVFGYDKIRLSTETSSAGLGSPHNRKSLAALCSAWARTLA